MLFCQWNLMNNGLRVSHPTWNNCRVARAVTRPTSKLAKRSDLYRQSRRLHSERNWNAMSFSAQHAVYSLKITMNRPCRRILMNFSKSLTRFHLTIDEFFNHEKYIIVNVYHSIFRRLLASLSFDRSLIDFFKIHSRCFILVQCFNFSKFTYDRNRFA